MVATGVVSTPKGAAILKGAAAKSVATKAAPAGGALLAGKGLGLGLGIGALGPIILGAVGAAAIYGYVKSRKVETAQAEEEMDIADAMAEI